MTRVRSRSTDPCEIFIIFTEKIHKQVYGKAYRKIYRKERRPI